MSDRPAAPDDLKALAELAAATLADCDTTHRHVTADTLRPAIEAVLTEATAQRWIQKQLDETGVRAMDFRNGMRMELEPAREAVAHWVAVARTMLGDAPNYSETKLEFDVKVAESPELYTLVVQRHAPGALTPHEARQKAEAALAHALEIVESWFVDVNDGHGFDASDLVHQLAEAGYRLPSDGPS